MSLGPKACGALGAAIGAECIGYTLYMVHNEGRFSLYLRLIGPVALVLGLAFLLAFLALPLEKLVKPTEIDGRLDYNLRNPSYTSLGWFLFILGFACSGLFFVYLKYGL
jgi:formate-dependent nitrite reductase membrane component NrfD